MLALYFHNHFISLIHSVATLVVSNKIDLHFHFHTDKATFWTFTSNLTQASTR